MCKCCVFSPIQFSILETMNPIAYLDTHIGYASRSFQVQGFRSAPSQTLREGWIRHKMILLYATVSDFVDLLGCKFSPLSTVKIRVSYRYLKALNTM